VVVRILANPEAALRVFQQCVDIVGREPVGCGISFKFQAVETTEASALCADPKIALLVLAQCVNLRLGKAFGKGVSGEVVGLGEKEIGAQNKQTDGRPGVQNPFRFVKY
jgi:hypothetical protein